MTWSGNAAADRELNRTYLDGMKRISQLRSMLDQQSECGSDQLLCDGHGSVRPQTREHKGNIKRRTPSKTQHSRRENKLDENNLALGAVAAGWRFGSSPGHHCFFLTS